MSASFHPGLVAQDPLLELNSEILCVPATRIFGWARSEDPGASEITLNQGKNDGIKVGFHLHAWPQERIGARELNPSYATLVKVTSVEETNSTAKIVRRSDSKPLSAKLYYQTPAFQLGTIVFAVSFDEATWKNRALMCTFLNELHLKCFSRNSSGPILLVVEKPTEKCAIEAQSVGADGPKQEQQRIIGEIKSFLREQSYITTMVLSFDWQEHNLELVQGMKGADPDKRLSELKSIANDAEQDSIAKAAEVRNAIDAALRFDAKLIEKLKAELRNAVDEAFKARHDLHFSEVASLTMKAQSMAQKLEEKTNKHSQIVDRRVDDLLNPNYRWDSINEPIETDTVQTLQNANTKLNVPHAKRGTVQGQVTLKGQPLKGKICFTNGGWFSGHSISEDGNFRSGGELPIGKCKVTIEPESASKAKAISPKYSAWQTTPLEIEIVPGVNTFQFELTGPSPVQ